ncbi:hypothetical protein IJ182_06795 [bacterium]|nr:hypothetical protein [bacterium]
MVAIAILLSLFPREILYCFTNDINVIKISISIINIVAIYQLFDGIQAISGGILRGFKMTKTASCCVISSYWLIGAPVAYFFVQKLNYSLKGYWIALAISLIAMGALEAAIAKWKYKKIKQQNP